MSNYCLTPISVAELKILVGKNFIAQFQKEIDPVIQPLRKHIALGRPASMGKELWEYAVADSITGGKWCGAGKGIADVSVGSNIGIDVKSVQTLKTSTTEASMYQPLSETELSSEYFKNKDKQQVWNLYVNGWMKKVSAIKEYYLLSIFRDSDTLDCSLAGFKISNTALAYLDTACTFSKQNKSMVVTSIIDPALANVKVYSGKTRLEIRIKEKIFKDPEYTMEIYKF